MSLGPENFLVLTYLLHSIPCLLMTDSGAELNSLLSSASSDKQAGSWGGQFRLEPHKDPRKTDAGNIQALPRETLHTVKNLPKRLAM